MDFTVWLLRILHIGAGIFWAGGSLMMSFFIGPAVAATADAGRQFSAHLMGKLRLRNYLTAAATITVLAGGILYWIDSDGFSSPWMNSSAGIGFGIGAGFGLIGFVFGAIFGSATAQLGQLGAQIKGKPTNEQLEQIKALQNRIAFVAPINTISMIIAIIFMSMARYLHLIF